ncbi:MAG TPA: hypothetical protein DDX19_07865 [Rhodopirellula baltica]|nr:hypothetical protein [Rhodopirellula baltica]
MAGFNRSGAVSRSRFHALFRLLAVPAMRHGVDMPWKTVVHPSIVAKSRLPMRVRFLYKPNSFICFRCELGSPCLRPAITLSLVVSLGLRWRLG